MKFLQNKGIKYHCVGLNPTTKKTFYVFLKNEKLNIVLNEWTLNKPV